uniref:Nibrin n=1 Tax=Latimeria chalumnae TaxID=7897 RepID=H3AIA2_LATCH
MWKLIPLTAAGEEPYQLLVGVEYIVGRKNCTILLSDDQSISRAHAVLTVSHPVVNLGHAARIPVLNIKDTSKYGTFVNEERMQRESPRSLNSRERVTFGVFESKFRVEYEPMIVCSSCLDGPGKVTLNQVVGQLGGHVVNSWMEDCTHLIMPSVKVTVKTICALICCRPIIKLEYFTELLKAIQSKQHLPTLESFFPPVDEPNIQPEALDLTARPERKSIFRGKTFIFLNAKQHKRLSPAVTLGGGQVKLVAECSKIESLLESTGNCILDVGTSNSQASISSSTKKWIESIITSLQSKGLRAISEAEIGLAVIFMSTELYCNPQQRDETETYTATIPGPTLSQSLAIDETTMPAATLNITAYVPDTEPSQELDTRMEVSGLQEVKETPEKEQRSRMRSREISVVKETPSTNSAEVLVTALRSEKERPENSLTSKSASKEQLSTRETSELGRSNEGSSQSQSSWLSGDFLLVRKKRERSVDEESSSQAKYTRTDREETQSFTTTLQKNSTEKLQRKQCPSLIPSEPFVVEPKQKPSVREAVCVSSEKAASKKRKEPNDLDDDLLLLAFESELLEGDADLTDQGTASVMNVSRKRRMVPEGKKMKLEETTPAEEISTAKVSEQSSENSTIRKEENELAESVKKERAVSNICEYDENLPTKLLLIEFKSLVVSRPRAFVQSTTSMEQGQVKNYKRFKKVAYPGAEGLPHIIGGSDLIAHQSKKNSELEEWLQQEMQEQSQRAREEFLSDDLFRYESVLRQSQ